MRRSVRKVPHKRNPDPLQRPRNWNSFGVIGRGAVRPPRQLFCIWLGAAAIPVVSRITRESLSDAPGALAARSHHGGNVDSRTSSPNGHCASLARGDDLEMNMI